MIDYNMDPESPIVRDRLRVQDSGLRHTASVGNRAVSQDEVRRNPELYFPQWFHPERADLIPSTFTRKEWDRLRADLRKAHPAIDIAWHPLREAIQVYIKNENIQSWWTKGWERVVMFEPWGKESLAVRIQAQLYFMKPELFNRARPSADRILYERELERRKFEEKLDEGARYNARDIYWRGLPKNISHGAKVAEQYE